MSRFRRLTKRSSNAKNKKLLVLKEKARKLGWPRSPATSLSNIDNIGHIIHNIKRLFLHRCRSCDFFGHLSNSNSVFFRIYIYIHTCPQSTIAQASSSCGNGSPDDLSELGCQTSTSSTALTSAETGLGSSFDGSSKLGRVIAQLEALKLQSGKSDDLTKNAEDKCNQKLSESLVGDSGMTPAQKVGALLKNRKIAPGALCPSQPEGCDTVKDATTSKNAIKKGDGSTPNPHVLPEHVSRLPLDFSSPS